MSTKDELKARIEFALSDGYKTKDNTQKQKDCTVCGTGFLGRDDSKTCSEKCRKAMQRA